MILITHDKLLVEDIVSETRGNDKGGVVTFLGTIRDTTDNHRVLYLEYEAYGPMAEKLLKELVAEIERKSPDVRASIAHRLGRLEIGEISMVVVVASPHRAEAFKICNFMVDQIKSNVPIWKKEVFETGEVWVGLQPSSD